MIELFMAIAGFGYLGASISYAFSGQPWLATTMMFYMLSIVTIYMSGAD
jgi:hypothetical protein